MEKPITVYLLHYEMEIGNPFNRLGTARHYVGSTDNLTKRLRQHSWGRSGAYVVKAFFEKGITFQVARTWENSSRQFEARLKKSYKHTPRLCPICNPETAMKRMQQ